MNIVYISSGTGSHPQLTLAASHLREEERDITLMSFGSEALDQNETAFLDAISHITEADCILISLHGSVPYFKKFPRLYETLSSIQSPVFIASTIPEEMEEYRPLFRRPHEEYTRIHEYLTLGGYDNMRSLLLFIYSRIRDQKIYINEPIRPPTHGIYHPGWYPGIQINEYKLFLKRGAMRAGILFWQGQFLARELDGVDTVITALEDEGFATIPVYTSSTPDPITRSPGIAWVVRQYFMHNGKADIDVLIVMMGFSQICLSAPGDGSGGETPENFFAELNVPVLQAISTNQSREEWLDNIQGLSPMEITAHLVWPEYDGQIITVPVSSRESEGEEQVIRGIAERAVHLAKTAKRWAELHHTPVEERRVALLLYSYGLADDAIGGAFGLDSPESAVQILHALQDAGYTCGDSLPASGQELIRLLQDRLTNTPDMLSGEEKMKRSAGLVSATTYHTWFSPLDPRCREEMTRDYGDPVGTILTESGQFLIPGRSFGNIFIGLQPPRGLLEEAEAVYHHVDQVMPHQYLAYYRWLKHIFKAQAIIHLGTHGTLEWLPGKGAGLSGACYPDLMLTDIPHLYPYIIDNPGEGIQAKRRSQAVILDHLIPAMTRAGGWGDLDDLCQLLQNYFRASLSHDDGKIQELLSEIFRLVTIQHLSSDLGISPRNPEDLIPELGRLYDYLCTARDALIKDGLHIFGITPRGERFCEHVYALTRMRNGEIPSLREVIAGEEGLDIQILSGDPSGWSAERQQTHGEILEAIDQRCEDLIRTLVSAHEAGTGEVDQIEGHLSERVREVARAIQEEIIPRVAATDDEMKYLIAGLNAGYVPPGPSGAPTRGSARILPTGKNFFSIDPATIPTPAAFSTGKRMAEQMIERYIADEGRYPRQVGIVVFATDTMKTGGDDIAYLLWLMGLKPLWSAYGGRVTGLEVVPIQELGRPRIDVTLRISGLFRDVFPGLIELIDEGVEMIATLNEDDETNYLAANLREMLALAERDGTDLDEARRWGLIRIFGCPPGTYGAGVADQVASSRWEHQADLAETYVRWGAHAYGRGLHGTAMPALFKSRLAALEVTVRNHNSRELDILDNDDDFMYHGGMIAGVTAFGGEKPASFVGDSSDPDRPVIRSVAEETKFLFRSRVLNPKWLEGLKVHRHRGAQELTALIDFAFGWDATSQVLEDWQYQALAEAFVLNDACKAWLENDNPHALRHMAGRLLEAVRRDMWSPDEETEEALRSAYLSIEAVIEGMSGDENRYVEGMFDR